MDRTCVRTGRSPETSGPSSPEATTPNVDDYGRGGKPPPRTEVSFVHGYSGSRERNAMEVAQFFESRPATQSTWGRVESEPLRPAHVALRQHRIHSSIDERLGGGHVGWHRASRVTNS